MQSSKCYAMKFVRNVFTFLYKLSGEITYHEAITLTILVLCFNRIKMPNVMAAKYIL